MKKITVTNLEMQFLTTLVKSLYAEPHFSDVEMVEIAQIMKITKSTAKGVLGSLVKKGIVYTDDDDFAGIVYLHDSAWECLHPEWYKAAKEWNYKLSEQAQIVEN